MLCTCLLWLLWNVCPQHQTCWLLCIRVYIKWSPVPFFHYHANLVLVLWLNCKNFLFSRHQVDMYWTPTLNQTQSQPGEDNLFFKCDNFACCRPVTRQICNKVIVSYWQFAKARAESCMPGSVSESHKIGGPRNSRVRENCCIDSNNRDVARRLISVRWLGDNWGVILPTRQEPVH